MQQHPSRQRPPLCNVDWAQWRPSARAEHAVAAIDDDDAALATNGRVSTSNDDEISFESRVRATAERLPTLSPAPVSPPSHAQLPRSERASTKKHDSNTRATGYDDVSTGDDTTGTGVHFYFATSILSFYS